MPYRENPILTPLFLLSLLSFSAHPEPTSGRFPTSGRRWALLRPPQPPLLILCHLRFRNGCDVLSPRARRIQAGSRVSCGIHLGGSAEFSVGFRLTWALQARIQVIGVIPGSGPVKTPSCELHLSHFFRCQKINTRN
ncbi:hypothetical protein RchiOBHm_Chr3g0492461 [Rosa chinensis]|uniref:Secreted protein n=1 Tax=Rosa chinensis TaxID=74649 RepID=A0A2P6RGJ1_ROSCH|nr:hypothetical protein RchiOBHm_Chr3g0492461 [Rosa chinensis]